MGMGIDKAESREKHALVLCGPRVDSVFCTCFVE